MRGEGPVECGNLSACGGLTPRLSPLATHQVEALESILKSRPMERDAASVALQRGDSTVASCVASLSQVGVISP